MGLANQVYGLWYWLFLKFLQNELMELTDFFAFWYKFMQKIKKWLKMLGVGMVKNGCGQ